MTESEFLDSLENMPIDVQLVKMRNVSAIHAIFDNGVYFEEEDMAYTTTPNFREIIMASSYDDYIQIELDYSKMREIQVSKNVKGELPITRVGIDLPYMLATKILMPMVKN